ncbi:MAG: hypothetical protein ACRDJH_16035 [Thermomicrobiales bacterium]
MTEAAYPSLPIRFVIEGIVGGTFALLDTGFDGYLAVPAALVAALPGPPRTRPIQTASGEQIEVPVYFGTVEFVDQPGEIEALIIAIGDEYLLGLATLNHFKVTFDHGQRVIVEQ